MRDVSPQNAHMCAYIAKDKILPYLIQLQEGLTIDSPDWVVVGFIIHQIEKGFFDWQQGSE